ncbi:MULTISPECIES: ribonucleotide-diphosphate reductase subunit beta [Bacillus amyloliquefaciens group]|uniref:ribonucleotide-diphosphate reductase subunit beta n=1 Tax=Bacillus amyloliquefaciens group TaxID=1938374 RepID=UPI00073C8093|nr:MULTISPECIES: ribonucleotide-diphosphate reductase subunit beta [Bacillus amyloliquefaciens group]KTF59082.1 hypothetical protein AR691_17520 [Bacillus amyloliquefaciens]
MKKRSPVKAIRWNHCKDPVIVEAHKLNQANTWTTGRISVIEDKVSWTKMSDTEKRAYVLTFLVLSRIDAEQGLVGMNAVAYNSPDNYTKATFTYQAGMEMIHSQVYHRALTEFIQLSEELKFTNWADDSREVNEVIEYLINSIVYVENDSDELVSYLLQLAYSTVLENYVFYLLFYNPLYEASVKYRMTKCAEAVRLIMRDESVHGSFSGYIFKKYWKEATEVQKEKVNSRFEKFLDTLYGRVEALLNFIYTDPFIIEDIKRFANFNLNRTLVNLGFSEVFSGDNIVFHPAVEAEVKYDMESTHDIFSMAGDSYFMMDSTAWVKDNVENVQRKLNEKPDLVPLLRG